MQSNTDRGAGKPYLPQAPPQIRTCPSRLSSARRKLLLLERCTTPGQARVRSQIEELVAADRRKDESLAILLHEVRSPLGSIRNAIAVLRTRSGDPLQQQMHELIERQVRQIALLTASLGQASCPPLPGVQAQLKRIDLCTVLWRAVETTAPEFDGRRHRLSVGMPEAAVWVLGDASRLEQVFINLLANASKYSDVGAGIHLSMHLCDGHAVVQVRDSGIGIAADALQSIFDPFVRADSAAVRLRSGSGIGLGVVRSIVAAHRGTVSAASEGLGQGSEFTVRLKLEP
jgi:signal transduction histidine kinase